MAKPKRERNKLFIKDWQKGLSNESLAEKYRLSPGGVKALKQRLRVKNSSLYQVTSTQTSTSTKRMTFWLKEGTIEKIKAKATKEGRTASEIAREIFCKNL